MERFVANVVQFLRNSPFPVNCTTFRLCKITTANDIQKMAPSDPVPSIVQYGGNYVSSDPWILDAIFGSKKQTLGCVSSKSMESSMRMRS